MNRRVGVSAGARIRPFFCGYQRRAGENEMGTDLFTLRSHLAPWTPASEGPNIAAPPNHAEVCSRRPKPTVGILPTAGPQSKGGMRLCLRRRQTTRILSLRENAAGHPPYRWGQAAF